MTANTLYSDFIDATDQNGNIKNNKRYLDYISHIALSIVQVGVDRFKAVYPFVGGTEYSHKFNMINPSNTDSAFRLTFPNGMTHSVNGIQGNGINQYAETFLVPSTDLLRDSNHVSLYSKTESESVGNIIDFGGREPVNLNNSFSLFIRYSGDLMSYDSPIRVSSPSSSSVGYFMGNRLDINTNKNFINGELITTNTNTNNFNLPNVSSWICGGRNGLGGFVFSPRLFSFVTIGYGINDNKVQQFSHNVRVGQGILNR
jgi:hypothetical protein